MNRAVSFANLLRLPALALARPVIIFFLAQPHRIMTRLLQLEHLGNLRLRDVRLPIHHALLQIQKLPHQPHQVVPELNRQLLLRRRVRLTIPNLREGSVVYLRMDPVSDEGETMWSTLAWYTLNRIPSR